MKSSFRWFIGLALLLVNSAATSDVIEIVPITSASVAANEIDAEPNSSLDANAAKNADCVNLPRPANLALKLLSFPDDWYQVYEAGPGVFALIEPYQYQEVISYLILGKARAL